MPKTKLGETVKHQKHIIAKRIETRKINTVSQMSDITYKDYRAFCDIVFETWIRCRDSWKCVLTSISYQVGDYEHYHACHFISRRILATRYLPENCHGQSGWLNYQQRLGNVQVIDQYRRFMYKKYGAETVKDLYNLSKKHTKWTITDWKNKAKELYILMLSVENGADIIKDRLKKNYKTIKEKYILEQIMGGIC